MNLKRFTVLSGFMVFLMGITFMVQAEELVVAPADPALAAAGQHEVSKNGMDTQWAWGEVLNLDAQAKTLILKYLDYETDQEKELVLVVDEKTVFENVKSFEEIKIKDTLSIDYKLGADGKNIAKNINSEKPDSSPVIPVPALESAISAEIVTAPVVDTSTPAVVSEQVPASLETPAPEVAQLSAQPEVVTPAPVVQQGQ